MNLKFIGHKKVIGNNISVASFENKNNEVVYINADETANKNSFMLKPQSICTLSYSGVKELNLFCESEADIDLNVIQELKTIQRVTIGNTPVKIDFGGIATEITIKNISGDTIYFNLNSSFKVETSYSIASLESLKISNLSIAFITIKSDETSNIEIFVGK